MGDDLYKNLGVSRNASQDEIKAAFRKLAREHHPDVGGEEERFKDINAAYQVLGNEGRRAEYDKIWRTRAEGGRPTTTSSEGSGSANRGTTRRGRAYTGDPMADLFGEGGGLGFDEIFNDLFRGFGGIDGLFGGTGFQKKEETFNIPENDWGLLHALQRAYEAKEDGEWQIKRVKEDGREDIPRELYKVKREGGRVTVYRRILDMRSSWDKEKPVEVGRGIFDENKKSHSADSFLSEYYFTYEGRRKLVNDSMTIPSGFDEYINALKSLARKFAKKETTNDGKSYDVNAELRAINGFTGISTYRYAQKGKRSDGKELIEEVSFGEFFNRLQMAYGVVEGGVQRGKEGGGGNTGEGWRD